MLDLNLVLNHQDWHLKIVDWFSIRLLMVVDSSSITHGPTQLATAVATPFSTTELVRALTHPPGGGPWISVTKAHRQNDPQGTGSGASRVTPSQIENFVFSASSLAHVDQVWLIGHNSLGDGDMNEAEIQALTHFMNSGGGVFATGDHWDLGVALAGKVPRVRSMRKWFTYGAPHGEPIAPDALDETRIDTTRANPPGQFPFDNQSDAIPMSVTPTWYPWGIWRYPHPLLCGHQGPIDVMPDHMHEGEVITPDGTDSASGWSGSGIPGGLSNTLTFNGEAFTEYPSLNGHQERPVIVCQADVIGGHTTPSTEDHVGSNTPVNGRRFANIGAYDGLRSGVGRVVVDSTWHHFFDINLIGDPTAPSPKNQGYNATASGQAALARIENYFVNIASWLSPGRGTLHILGTLLKATRSAQAVEMAPGLRRGISDARYLAYGESIYAALRRFLPPCAILDLVLIEYYELQPVWKLPDPPDPWKQRQLPQRNQAVDTVAWTTAAVGGMAAHLVLALHEYRQLPIKDAREHMRHGMVSGLRALAKRTALRASGELEAAKDMLNSLPDDKAHPAKGAAA